MVIEIHYLEVSAAGLTAADALLREAALQAAERAYAPYSGFQVGAAALLENGEVVTGCNQENAASPSGLCAERVALSYAGARYPGVPVSALAIIAVSGGEIRPRIAPCGACCQVMQEMEKRGGRPMRILLCGKETVRILSSVSSLLPFSFTEEDLEI